MPISHQHTPFTYNEFVAPMDANYLIGAVDLKQNLYNQGTAAIEAKMQELAGFDIAKQEDRAYANQELKKIYQAMQSGASKDFSNPQVVRSFLDVVKPLERDDRFKNAIDSTAELRKRQKTIADIKTKNPGQYSQANESEYMDDVEAWMADPNAGATLYHKEYTPWKDISKEMVEMTAAIKADVKAEAKLDKTGKYILETQVEKVTAERIQAAINTLDPSYKRQIYIDAKYQAKNTDGQTKWEAVSADLKEVYDKNMEYSRIANIENSPDNPEGLTAADFRRIAGIAAEDLNKMQGDVSLLNQSYASHYVNNWQTNMITKYAYEQESIKMKDNPYALVKANLDATITAAKLRHELDWINKEKELLLTGQAKKNEYGEVVNDPDYRPGKLTEAEKLAEASQKYVFSRDKAVNKKMLESDKIPLEESIYNGTLSSTIQKTAAEMDGTFKDKLESAVRFIIGNEEWDDDYGDGESDYNVRFEPMDIMGVDANNKPIVIGKTTKVTLVDKDRVFIDNLSFTIGELLQFSAMNKSGDVIDPATGEITKDSNRIAEIKADILRTSK